MNRINNKSVKFFTLVEVLVAVAVLVIMMGFLFQFTAGAQRIWQGTQGRVDRAQQAEVTFNLLKGDLANMVCCNEAEFACGYYTDSTNFCFIVADPDRSDSLAAVCYVHVPAAGSLDTPAVGRVYRIYQPLTGTQLSSLQKNMSSPAPDPALNPTLNSFLGQSPLSFLTGLSNTSDRQEYIVAENVTAFTINCFSTSPSSRSVKPQTVRIDMTVDFSESLKIKSNTNNVDNTSDYTKQFSRLFFLN